MFIYLLFEVLYSYSTQQVLLQHECILESRTTSVGVFVSADTFDWARRVLTLKLGVLAGGQVCTLVYVCNSQTYCWEHLLKGVSVNRAVTAVNLYLSSSLRLLHIRSYSCRCSSVWCWHSRRLRGKGRETGGGTCLDTHMNTHTHKHDLWWDDIRGKKKSELWHEPCSKHLYPCCPLETVFSGHSPQVNASGCVCGKQSTPLKQGWPRQILEEFPQNFPLKPGGHRQPTTWGVDTHQSNLNDSKIKNAAKLHFQGPDIDK